MFCLYSGIIVATFTSIKNEKKYPSDQKGKIY